MHIILLAVHLSQWCFSSLHLDEPFLHIMCGTAKTVLRVTTHIKFLIGAPRISLSADLNDQDLLSVANEPFQRYVACRNVTRKVHPVVFLSLKHSHVLAAESAQMVFVPLTFVYLRVQ